METCQLLRTLIISGVLTGSLLPVASIGADPVPLAPLPDTPPVPSDASTARQIELGKMLYFDPRLSGDGSTSCASCHEPELGWGDGAPLSRGYPGTVHWRNSQSILNVAYLNKFFWTGSAATLEAQAKGAMTGPLAQNMNPGLAEERLKQIPKYVQLFQAAYNGAPTFDNTLAAISTFERTLVSKNVPFDRYLRGDKHALSPKQIEGYELFRGKAGCIQCHQGMMVTDEQFHNVGVPVNEIFARDPLRQIAMRERIKAKGINEAEYLAFDRDPGRYLDTKKAEDKGKFRTPTLRELKYTAPYMHNGVFASLDDVIEFYNRGGADDPFGTKSPLIKPLTLTVEEMMALRAFLESLSGDPVVVSAPKLPDYAALPLPPVAAAP